MWQYARNLILEHNNLSLSNNRLVHEGFPFSSSANSALRWEIVDSNSYKDVNANLFPSGCNRKPKQIWILLNFSAGKQDKKMFVLIDWS